MTDPKIAAPNVRCARCGAAMTCSPDDIASCPCNTITLEATTRAWIAANHSGCLCSSCLREEQLRSKKRDLSGR